MMSRAKVINIISTPFLSAAGRNKASYIKMHTENTGTSCTVEEYKQLPKAQQAKFLQEQDYDKVFTFYPNTDLETAARTTNQNQDNYWVKLWVDVAKKTRSTNGVCFVIVKNTGPKPFDFIVEGRMQGEEEKAARQLGIPIKYVKY